MAMRTQYLDRELKLALDRQLSPETMGRHLADFSRRKLAEVIARGEGSPNYVTIVNGRRGAREESVRLPGPIVHEFIWWPQVLSFALGFLRNRSPGTGPEGGHKGRRPYRDSFFVLANGAEVTPRQFAAIDPGAEVLISNDAPYSRKLDVQLIGRQPIRVSVPPGIFEDAAEAVRAKFGGLLTVKRLYTISFTGQYIRKGGRDTSQPWELTRSGGQAGKPVHSPTLQLTPRPG